MDFKEMAENLDLEENEFMELIALFVESGISDLGKLESAFEMGKTEDAANAAHSLKGAAVNLGLMDIHAMADKLEVDARDGRLEESVTLVQILRAALDNVAGRIKG